MKMLPYNHRQAHAAATVVMRAKALELLDEWSHHFVYFAVRQQPLHVRLDRIEGNWVWYWPIDDVQRYQSDCSVDGFDLTKGAVVLGFPEADDPADVLIVGPSRGWIV